MGIVGYNAAGTVVDQVPSLWLNPTEGSWKKVYVNLTTEVSQMTSATKFAVFFSMLKDVNVSTSYFYLDNVKLVN